MSPVTFGRARTALACALLVAFAQVGYADDVINLGTVDAGPDALGMVDETPTRWFVELASPPVADGGSLSTVRAEKNAFRKAAKAAGIKFTERFAFDTLFNGVSVQIEPKDFGKLSRLTGVKALYPVITEALPKTEPGSDLDMANAIGMTGADIAQNELGLSGAGVKVAVIDSGIDYDHPDFGGNGTPGDGISPDPNFGPSGNSRVKYGYDFVGDDYNAAGSGGALTPHPDDNPDSCRNYNGDSGSHGTHVAGIVGASGSPPSGVRGVAPGVTFGAYRVFGCFGSTDSDIMVAAMERALADGMQVINMSIGSTFQWPQYPTAAAATRMVNKGISVVASIGNSGAASSTAAGGIWTAGAPGTGAKVIGVASFDNTKASQKAFSVNSTLYGYNQATASPPAPISGSLPITGIVGSTPAGATVLTSTNAGCNGTTMPADLTGQIAMVRRGTCGFYEKALNMQARHAAAVLLFDNQAGNTTPTVAPVAPLTTPITIPVVMTNQANGNAIAAILPQNLTWTSQVVETVQTTAGLISSFSSWGLAADLSLKPDIGAPGGSIRSTYPIEYGSYASISGTSMASPHVAGAVALLLEAKPNTPTNAIRDLLQNQAVPHLWNGNPGLGFLEPVHRQGAGMLQIASTITATTHVSPGKLSLGESELGPVTKSLTVRNEGASDETYDLSFSNGLATTGSYSWSVFNAPSSVSFSQAGVPTTSITVPAGGSGTFEVTVAPNGALANKALFGGFVNVSPQSNSGDVSVPVAGFKGDYQSIQVLTPTANGFPWLAQQVGSSLFNRSAGGTYTMSGVDFPIVLAHFDHQSRRVRFEVFGTNGKSYQRAFQDEEYFGKNSTSGGFFSFLWDGTTTNGSKQQQLPNGTYRIKMSVLKANGDESNPAHWETFTTPVITVARP